MWLLVGVLSPFKQQYFVSVLLERFEVKNQILELTKGLDHAPSQHRNFTTAPPVRTGKFTLILSNIIPGLACYEFCMHIHASSVS
jgi:hypothetical protein